MESIMMGMVFGVGAVTILASLAMFTHTVVVAMTHHFNGGVAKSE